MGWKSTIQLTRYEAIQAIMNCIDRTPFDSMSNAELEEVMYRMGMGDDTSLPYYGHNFDIVNKEEEKEKTLWDN